MILDSGYWMSLVNPACGLLFIQHRESSIQYPLRDEIILNMLNLTATRNY